MIHWTEFFLKGLAVGFCIAAPVGPIGILCIQRTLHFGRFSGFFSGLGAATADTLYGIIAAFSLTFIEDFLHEQRFWIRLIGGLFLLYLGARIFLSKPKEKAKEMKSNSLFGDFLSTLLLTLTNPLTILSFIAVFASLQVSEHPSYLHGTFLVLGVFFGSALWWFLLSEGITMFRKRVSDKAMLWINRGAGVVIFLFGLGAIALSRSYSGH
jgi:threonine/homoserine/homoserine lactone efflux protein